MDNNAEDDPWYPEIYSAARIAFETISPENSFKVDLTELETLCSMLNISILQYEFTQAMYDLDTSGDMVIQLDDFCKWWLAKSRKDDADAAAAALSQAVASPTAPRMWETIIDGDATYYYDHVTGDTRWALPELLTALFTTFDSTECNQDRSLLELFVKYDLLGRQKLDEEEWQGLLIGIGMSSSAVTIAELTGLPLATEMTYEQLHAWWFANVPQRSRKRLTDWTEWWETLDEGNRLLFSNERNQSIQWHSPGLPAVLQTLLDGLNGATLDDKTRNLFKKLDVDMDNALSSDEFQNLLTQLNMPNLAQEQIQAAMLALQPDGLPVSFEVIDSWWKTCYRKALLGDWEEAWDDQSNLYYYNWKTQQTQWEPPAVTSHMHTLLDKFSSDPAVSTNERIRRLFVQYDTDETGTLDGQEIKRICAVLGYPLDEAALDTMMRVLDTSGDGLVSLEEFQTWWHSKQHIEQQFNASAVEISRTDEIRSICATYLHQTLEAFSITPIDSNFSRLIQALGRTCRGSALLKALHEMDTDGARLIEPEIFVQWYMKYDAQCSEKEKQEREIKRAKEAMDVWNEETNEQGQVVYVNARTREVMWEKPGIQQRMAALMKGADIKAVFRQFDRDQSGSIDKSELKGLLLQLGQSVDEKQLEEIMEIIDTSGDGVVSLDELTTWWVCMQRRSIATANAAELQSKLINYHELSKDSIKELRALFNQFDTDKSGSIDQYELKHLLGRLGYFPSEKERVKLLNAIDTSGDGQMNQDEFIAWWVATHRTREIEANASRAGHLLSDLQAANQSKSKEAAPSLDLSDLSLSALRNKLVDIRYNWTKGPIQLPLTEEQPVNYGARKFGTIDVTFIHPEIVNVMRLLVDDVVLITPLMLPDAAQRIQKMYRAKLARQQLITTLNERYVHHHDPATGASYYMNRLTKEIRFTKPLILGRHEILSPRTKLREKHVERAMRYRRNWMVSIMNSSNNLQSSGSFRSAAFYVYEILCQIKARWKRGVWEALNTKDYTLAQLVVRRYPRQLKKPGEWGDMPLHYAIRHQLDMDIIRTFLHGHTDVISMQNASGYTPLHLACRDNPKLQLLHALLNVPHGAEMCKCMTFGTNQTPLHLAIRHHAPLPFIEALIEADGSCLFQRNHKRNTPFHEAIISTRSDAIDIVRLCISKQTGTQTLASLPVYESAWPLHLVFLHEMPDAMIECILDLAPEAVAVPYHQLLPVFLAMKYRRSESLVRGIAERSITLNDPATIHTPKGFNPLHYALMYSFSSSLILYFLTLHPPWASEVTKRKEYPLHLAAIYSSDVNVLKKLLLIDPTPARQSNSMGYLPLHLAVLRGDVEIVKKLLQVCPWSLLDTVKGTKYDSLLLAAKAKKRFPNEPLVDALLRPPKMAPHRSKYKLLELSPYYIASTSSQSTMTCFDKLHLLDQCTTDDLEAMAKKKMRQNFHKPTSQWEFSKILRLMALNPIDAAIQTRSLLAINTIVKQYSEAEREKCLEKYDIIRTLQHTMYDFTTNPRIQLLGQSCLDHLLPNAFAKAKYQSRIDPLYKF